MSRVPLWLLWLACAGVASCSDGVDPTSASSTGSSEGAGANSCSSQGTPCETCAFSVCPMEVSACSSLSECNAAGEPTSGCLALAACIRDAECGGCIDTECTENACLDERNSAGGPYGQGTKALGVLGQCVLANCALECGQFCTVGCVEDGACTLEDDCVCADCHAEAACSDPANCLDNGACDAFNEGCGCSDCARHPECES